MTTEELLINLRADPALTRPARIAIGLSMHEDGFAARDVARIASLRMALVVDLRRAISQLDPTFSGARPRGAPALHQSHPDYQAPRSLALVVAALASTRTEAIPRVAGRLGLRRLTAFGIRRAIDYARSVSTNPDLPPEFRCPNCEQRSLHHPCSHCGHAWLRSA